MQGLGIRLGIIGVIVVGVLAFFGIQYWLAGMSADVYIENYSGKNVVLELDGEKWETVNDSNGKKVTIKPKKYELTVREVGSNDEIDKFTIDATNGHSNYILNVGGQQHFQLVEVVYSTAPNFGDGDRVLWDKNDKWIEFKADYIFKDPPNEIKTSSSRVTKKWLRRASEFDLVPMDENLFKENL